MLEDSSEFVPAGLCLSLGPAQEETEDVEWSQMMRLLSQSFPVACHCLRHLQPETNLFCGFEHFLDRVTAL